MPTPLRVCHVISALNAGGAERVLLTILQDMRGVDHTLAVANGGDLLPQVPASARVRRAGTDLELAHVIASTAPDIIHTWLDGSLLLASVPAAASGVPVLHRICNVPSVMATFPPVPAAHHAMVARALAAASHVVALSDTAADDAVTFYGIRRPAVIYNGVPLAGLRRRDVAGGPTRTDRRVILNVARLAPEKGQDCLIQAMVWVAARHPETELWIAGSGPLENALRAQADALGIGRHVKLIGFDENVTALHRAADVFVFPSITEGFGNALLEAMAAGLPTVASDLPVIRHDILGDAPAALLATPADPVAFADALHTLLSDGAARRHYAEAARRIAARFTVSAMIGGFQAAYEHLARKDRQHAAA